MERFDHLREGNVLMRVRLQGAGLDLREQLGHARVILQAHAQGQRIDEEADQRLELAARAVRHRRADHQIALPTEPAQQRRPARKQRHEQGHAVTLAQTPQPRRQLRRQRQPHTAAGVTLHRRTRPVARQLQ